MWELALYEMEILFLGGNNGVSWCFLIALLWGVFYLGCHIQQLAGTLLGWSFKLCGDQEKGGLGNTPSGWTRVVFLV